MAPLPPVVSVAIHRELLCGQPQGTRRELDIDVAGRGEIAGPSRRGQAVLPNTVNAALVPLVV